MSALAGVATDFKDLVVPRNRSHEPLREFA